MTEQNPRYSIGVDLGGTNLRAAAIDSTGRMLGKVAGQTQLSAGPDAVVRDMVAAIVKLRSEFGEDRLAGVGIGSPGIIVMETGMIMETPNLPGFEGFPLRDRVNRALGAPVILENDANAAALGEKWVGAGKDVDDLILLTLGTGIGGGIIYRGQIMHGAVGMAGELGHIRVVPNGNPCACGNCGCLEKHASATAVVTMARLMGLGSDLTAADVCRLAAAGNPRAIEVWRVAGQALGAALVSLINIFNPPLVLLSGGMLGAWDFFAPAMLGEVRQYCYVWRNSPARIEKALLGNEAGLYGAARLPFNG
jgi:glucokinase